ncbi:MAG: class I SAM-dependent methyltransferase [Dehalococcoidia bacterium]
MVEIVSKLERLVPDETPIYMRHLYRLHEARYRFAADHVASKQVLDVACGVGYGAALLADAGASTVFGVDVSREAIAYAQSRYARTNIHYVVADAAVIGMADHSVDVVTSFETIEHLEREKTEPFLQELQRVLKPGGAAFISTPNGESSYKLGAFHTVEFSFAEFRSLLGRYFPQVTFFGQRMIPLWYLTLAAKARRLPLMWCLDAIVRVIFFSSVQIENVPAKGALPMFFVAQCVSR